MSKCANTECCNEGNPAVICTPYCRDWIAHKTVPECAGPVGSSDLMVAREGDQRDTTTQSAGPDGRPQDGYSKSCGACRKCDKDFARQTLTYMKKIVRE